MIINVVQIGYSYKDLRGRLDGAESGIGGSRLHYTLVVDSSLLILCFLPGKSRFFHAI